MADVEEEPVYECIACTGKTKELCAEPMKSHYKAVHKTHTIPCSKKGCPFFFPTRSDLKQHEADQHNPYNPHKRPHRPKDN